MSDSPNIKARLLEELKILQEKNIYLKLELEACKSSVQNNKNKAKPWYHEDIFLLQKSALDAAANCIVITNKNGDVIWVNSAFTKLTGYSAEEMIYKNMNVLSSGKQDPYYYKSLWERILDGNVWQGEIINRKKDGTNYFEEQTITPVLTENNQINYFIAIKQDISGRKRAEEREKQQYEQLIQANKLAALGTLVAGVAHEINNPNNFIMLNVPMLINAWNDILPVLDEYSKTNEDYKILNLEYSRMRQKLPEMCSNIREGSKRIKNIVQELRQISVNNKVVFEIVDVNRVILSAISLLENFIKESTDVFILSLWKGSLNAKSNYQYLEQVIINLIQNSCQSLKDKTKGIYISSGYNEAGNKIEIKIRDEGGGISTNNLSRITDPFFTTKRDTGGTGLGLAVSSRMIRDIGGTLEFVSVEQEGTTATILLPFNNEAQPEIVT